MIIVDTQAVIWLTQADPKLSGEARRALEAGRGEGSLAIAAITLREIATLVSKRRVQVSSSLSVYLTFIESLFKVLPLTAEIAERSVCFGPAYPKDLADQIIGATALVYGAKLVTADEQIRGSGEVECVW